MTPAGRAAFYGYHHTPIILTQIPEHRETLHSGGGMLLKTCQPQPCASLVGAVLAEIPVVLPNLRRLGQALSKSRSASFIS